MGDELELIKSQAQLNDEVSSNLAELLKENNPDEIKRIVDMFNLQQSKKNIVRASQVGDLIDLVLDGYREKLCSGADELPMDKLGDAFRTLLMAAEKFGGSTQKAVEVAPSIRTNITVNNINGVELSRESRDKVIEAIQSLMEGNIATVEEEK